LENNLCRVCGIVKISNFNCCSTETKMRKYHKQKNKLLKNQLTECRVNVLMIQTSNTNFNAKTLSPNDFIYIILSQINKINMSAMYI
jgi:hypothetical protein